MFIFVTCVLCGCATLFLTLRKRSVKVVENSLLKKVSVSKRWGYAKVGENCIMRNLMINNDNHILLVSLNQEG